MATKPYRIRIWLEGGGSLLKGCYGDEVGDVGAGVDFALSCGEVNIMHLARLKAMPLSRWLGLVSLTDPSA